MKEELWVMSCCGSFGRDSGRSGGDLRDLVRESYARIAESGTAGCGSGCCGTVRPEELARRIGYEQAELAGLPEGANLGLSCGYPVGVAELKEGEVVLDLGCGAGFDCFIAGRKVGAEGRVIGVDMTPQMIQRARRNLEEYRRKTGLDNVEFRLGEIEHLPVADASVDVVISNCVINLSADKPQVWREVARVLKPGGRVAVSDIALLKPLPEEVRGMVEALVGCVAGAVLKTDYQRMVEAAGLVEVRIQEEPEYVAALSGVQDALYRKITEALPRGASLGEYICSVDVRARKAG